MSFNGTVLSRGEEDGGLVFEVEVCVPTGGWESDGGRMEKWVVRTIGSGLSGRVVSETGEDDRDCRLINLTGEELVAGSAIQVRLVPEPLAVVFALPTGFLGC